MADHLLDLSSCDLEIFSGVESLGLLGENAANACGHGKSDVGVDIDLANSHLRRFAELLLGNTDSIGKFAAESVDFGNALMSDAGSTVQNDGEAGKSLADFFEDIKTERRGNEYAMLVSRALLCGELVCAVGGTDRDGEGVNTGSGDEFLNLFGLGVRGMLCDIIN